ncbi:hypothetical protein [uncultured Pedobacter sp.]|uniref:hypothetical protein n=1 Tax=uncultured Pedobacter sp. TaxID=246139 RepID=UPI00260E6639|nr:hypothetical protein [uncultured Pedobacter sp.]
MKCNYFEYLGLTKDEYPRISVPYQATTDLEMAKHYLAYLREVNETRNTRQNTIETKTSQIIGQSSFIISIIALFIPLLADQFSDLGTAIKYILVVFFIFLVLHFILATVHALQNLQIEKSRYMEGSTRTVTKETRAVTELDFLNEQIKDLIAMINHNNSVTNKAAAGLVYAARCFKMGIWIFLIFIFSLLVAASTLTKQETLAISNLKELRLGEIYTEQNKNKEATKALEKQIDSLKYTIGMIERELSKRPPHKRPGR